MKAKKNKSVAPSSTVAVSLGFWWYLLACLTGLAVLVQPWLPTENLKNAATAHFMDMLPVFMGLGFLAICFWFKGYIKWEANLFPWLLLAFTATKLLSSFLGLSLSRGLWGAWSHYADGTIFWFILTVASFTVFLLRPPLWAIRLFLYGVSLQWLAISIPVVDERCFEHKERAVSILGNSNTFIAYSVLILPVVIGLGILLFREAKSRSADVVRKVITWSRLAALLICLSICVYALYACLPVKLQFLMLNKTPAAQTAVVSNLLPSGSSVALLKNQTGKLKQFIHSESNTQRYTLWEMGLRAVKYSFPFGTGPGSVRFLSNQLSGKYSHWNYWEIPDSFHNELLDIMNQNGLIGILVYLFWLGWTVRYLWKARGRLQPEQKILLISLATGAVLYWIFLQSVFTVHIPGLLFVLWLSLAVIIAQPSVPESCVKSSADWRKVTFALISGILIVLVLYHGVCFRMADKAATVGNYAGTQQSDIATARQELARAVVLFPYEENYQRLAAVYHFQSAGKCSKDSPEFKMALNMAMTNAEKAYRLNSVSPQAVLTRGVVGFVISQFQPEQYLLSINDFESAIKLSPNDPMTYKWIGVALQIYPGRITIPDFERLVSLTPQSRQEALRSQFR